MNNCKSTINLLPIALVSSILLRCNSSKHYFARAQNDGCAPIPDVSCVTGNVSVNDNGAETATGGNCCQGEGSGVNITPDGISCSGDGKLGTVVNCVFIVDGVQPSSSVGSSPSSSSSSSSSSTTTIATTTTTNGVPTTSTGCGAEIGLGPPCKEDGKEMCAPDVTATCNANGNGCVDLFGAPVACVIPASTTTTTTTVGTGGTSSVVNNNVISHGEEVIQGDVSTPEITNDPQSSSSTSDASHVEAVGTGLVLLVVAFCHSF